TGMDATDGTTGMDGTDGVTGMDAGFVEPTVETCPALTEDTGGEICVVAGGTGNSLIIVGDVLTPGTIYENGSVLIGVDGKIACVGCDCAAADARRVVCPGAAISPGLIDAHNHVGWLNGKPWTFAKQNVDPKHRWEHRHDWRCGDNADNDPEINVDGGGANKADKTFGEFRYVLGGGTAIFGSGDLGGVLRDLDDTGSGDSGLQSPGADYDTFPLGDAGCQKMTGACAYNGISGAGSNGDAYGPHVSEGIDLAARNEFLCLTGQQSGGVDVLDDRSAIIHGVGLIEPDVALMAQRGISLIWSPRSNVSLYGETARVVLHHKFGVNIALGVDWLPSGSMNMLRELKCADELNEFFYNGHFTDEALWLMTTRGAARALGFDTEIGEIKVGLMGDIAVFAGNGKKFHRAILDANPGDTALVLKGGSPLSGDTALVEALTGGCDDIGDVCGRTKRLCVSEHSDYSSWSDLQTAVGSPEYKLFFCDTPDDEPSCLPARELDGDIVNNSNVYSGMSMVGDQDGDGVSDDVDNCPTIFNPIRPLDGGVQADFDSDGVGGVCDPCPLDADQVDNCTSFNANDGDGDGVDNDVDNCPTIANPAQLDDDTDMKGNECDACPMFKNPGTAGCLVTIPDLKMSEAHEDTSVQLLNVVVTGHTVAGFFVQQVEDVPDAFSGLYIFDPIVAKPAIGSVIDLAGEKDTFFGTVELKQVVVTEKGTGSVTPVILTAEQVTQAIADQGQGAWDAMLVTVGEQVITTVAPALGQGTPEGTKEFELDSGLRLADVVWSSADEFPAFEVGDQLSAITGHLSWLNEYVKLYPGTPDDFAFGAIQVKQFVPAVGYQRVGESGPTIGGSLTVELNFVTDVDLEVTVVSDDDLIAKVIGSPLTIAAGTKSIVVPIEGVGVGTAILTANIDNDVSVTGSVEVIAADAVPVVLSAMPTSVVMPVNSSQTFTVTLSHPTPAAGASYDVAVSADVDAVDATVAGNMLTFDVVVTAKADETTGTLTVGGVEVATISVVDIASTQLDISGYIVKQTDSNREILLPSGTILIGGSSLIITRDSSKGEFEAEFGVLPADTVFIRSTDLQGSEFPSINGAETFSIVDTANGTVDGATVPLESGECLQRNVPVAAAGEATSWTDGEATPGLQTITDAPAGLYISETCDVTGTGNFVFEYVEIHFDGGT
ncbi:MAG: hypothetical protein ACI9OJ_005103, partial [Myxococcota bacterium]